MSGAAGLPYRIADSDAVTEDVRILRLEPEDGAADLDWRAGQYIAIALDGFEARNFSIANRPGGGGIEVHVRRSGSGGLSDTLSGAAVGTRAAISGPFGATYFREQHGGPVLAIAGGTGLAPMKAVVEAALASDLARDIHLYAGVRTEADLYLERYFIALTRTHSNFRYVAVIAEPAEHSGRRTGPVGHAVAADFQLLYGHQVYLAGPPAMTEACRTMLTLKGVPPHDIFCDLFYADPPA